MKQIALIVIYNSPYEKNIPVIEAIYHKRFSNIYHLVPFYQGNQTNVIPVYGEGEYFQNFLPQALPYFFNEQYKHYFFIADDLLINPRINENNFVETMRLDDDSCFTSRIISHTQHLDWPHSYKASCFSRRRPFIDITQELPGEKEAKVCLERFLPNTELPIKLLPTAVRKLLESRISQKRYQDTKIPRYQDTKIPRYQDTKIPRYQEYCAPYFFRNIFTTL